MIATFLTFLFLPSLIVANNEFAQRQEFRSTIHANLPLFMDCYDRGLKTNPQLRGKVILEWDVNDQGNIQNAKIKSSKLGDAIVESCMVEKLKSLKFTPAPTGEIVHVLYPLTFDAKK